MKKLFVLLISLFLLSSFVLAENNMEKQLRDGPVDEPGEMGAGPDSEPKDMPEPVLISAGGQGEMEQEQERKRNGSGPVMMEGETMVHAGLNNALSNVENENARESIQRNMERFIEKYQARLSKMDNVTVEIDEESGETTVKAKQHVRFFGFINGKATKRFNIDAEGNVKEKSPWYRFMYSEVKSE